jgi:hypothetical protein
MKIIHYFGLLLQFTEPQNWYLYCLVVSKVKDLAILSACYEFERLCLPPGIQVQYIIQTLSNKYQYQSLEKMLGRNFPLLLFKMSWNTYLIIVVSNVHNKCLWKKYLNCFICINQNQIWRWQHWNRSPLLCPTFITRKIKDRTIVFNIIFFCTNLEIIF